MAILGGHLLFRWKENDGHFSIVQRASIVELDAVRQVAFQICGQLRNEVVFKTAINAAKLYYKNKGRVGIITDTELTATAIAALFSTFRCNGKMLNAALEGTKLARVNYNAGVSQFISRKINRWRDMIHPRVIFISCGAITASLLVKGIRNYLLTPRLCRALSILDTPLGNACDLMLFSTIVTKLCSESVYQFIADLLDKHCKIATKLYNKTCDIAKMIMGSETINRLVKEAPGKQVRLYAECFSNEGPILMRDGCSATLPTTLKCTMQDARQYLTAYAPCFYRNCRLASSCGHNAYRAFATRQAQIRKSPNPVLVKELEAFVQDFIKRLDINVKSVMSFDEWNKSYPMVKQQANREARRRLEENGWSPLDFPKNKSFVKSEIILKSPDEDPSYDPRLITGVETEYNVCLGPFMATVREIMKSLFSTKQSNENEYATYEQIPGLVFSCGMNKEALGKYVGERLDECKDPIPYEADFTRYDGSMTQEILQVLEHAFYVSLFGEVIRKMMNVQLESGGKIGNPFNTFEEMIEFVMDACRRSGDQNTTNGNSFINLVLNLFAINKQCVGGLTVYHLLIQKLLSLIFLGDDGLNITEGLELDKDAIRAVMSDLGLSVKLKKPNVRDMTFCSNLFVPTADGYVATQYPGRLLSKCFVTRSRFTEAQSKQWLHDQAYNYWRDSYHIPFLREWFESVRIANHTAKRIAYVDVDRANSTTDVQNLHCQHAHQPDDHTQVWLNERYGITRDQYGALGAQLIHLTHADVLSSSRYIDLLKHIINVDLGYTDVAENANMGVPPDGKFYRFRAMQLVNVDMLYPPVEYSKKQVADQNSLQNLIIDLAPTRAKPNSFNSPKVAKDGAAPKKAPSVNDDGKQKTPAVNASKPSTSYCSDYYAQYLEDDHKSHQAKSGAAAQENYPPSGQRRQRSRRAHAQARPQFEANRKWKKCS